MSYGVLSEHRHTHTYTHTHSCIESVCSALCEQCRLADRQMGKSITACRKLSLIDWPICTRQRRSAAEASFLRHWSTETHTLTLAHILTVNLPSALLLFLQCLQTKKYGHIYTFDTFPISINRAGTDIHDKSVESAASVHRLCSSTLVVPAAAKEDLCSWG